MRRYLVIPIAALVSILVPASSAPATTGRTDGQVVRDWTDLAFAAVRQARASDAVAARAYAMVNVAMYDAVNGLASHPRWTAIVPPSTGNAGDPAVAAAVAAHGVLSALLPALQADYDAQLADDLAMASSPGQAKHGQAWGEDVAAAVLAARANDGSSPHTTRPFELAVGKFRGNFGGVQFRNLQPFAIADSSAYTTAAPPALDSPEYAAAYNDVKVRGFGGITDPDATATFEYWALASGTNQPPGAWLQVASTLSDERDLSLADTARLFALQSMALADTVAPTYTIKDRHFSWRPATAINEGHLDDNPATERQMFWFARGGSSGSPEFWSGHSSFSAAGAGVLAGFFCDDTTTFTLVTDSSKGLARTYDSFSDAANEAGESRILGGLHFEFSNEAGLAAGRAVAAEVLQREGACA